MVRSKNDKAFDVLVYGILLFVLLITLIPVMFVVSMSFTPYAELIKRGGFVLIPTKVTLGAYREMLGDGLLLGGMWITVQVTVIGTTLNLIATTLTAYPLSRRQMPGSKLVTKLIIFTMLFSAGTIPTYLIVKATGVMNTIWAMIIPSLITVYNLIVMKAFFEGLPEELFEAARIDGASEFGVLIKIVMPMSLPIMMTIGMYYAVSHWNAYMVAVLYISDAELRPMQVILRRMLKQANMDTNSVEDVVPAETLRMAAVCFATAPIVIIYPFIQKYFVKGTLAGAVKG
ncbi:MAG: carbohydrate ABC transporter permease [Clostridia bacterium]|nr:carbohydrate ABC transporter permease [Clostridia bacterium]